MEPVIQIQEVTKKYSSAVVALRKLNLEVLPREIYGLLGPNGSGKTTTIKLLLGLIRPTQGEVRVFGSPPGSLLSKFKIGYQPEESYFYPFLNSYETLDFYGQLYGIPRKERRKRIDFLLELVGLRPKDGKRKIREYSKGMTRRIGLAQALINDPTLLILDEPTAGLDPIGSREFKDLLKNLRDEGKTILLSSHLLADVADTSNRVVILYRGEVVEQGAVGDLLSSEKVTEIHLQNFREDLRDELEVFCKNLNLEVLEIRPLRQTLENIFLRTIREKRDEENSSSG